MLHVAGEAQVFTREKLKAKRKIVQKEDQINRQKIVQKSTSDQIKGWRICTPRQKKPETLEIEEEY